MRCLVASGWGLSALARKARERRRHASVGIRFWLSGATRRSGVRWKGCDKFPGRLRLRWQKRAGGATVAAGGARSERRAVLCVRLCPRGIRSRSGDRYSFGLVGRRSVSVSRFFTMHAHAPFFPARTKLERMQASTPRTRTSILGPLDAGPFVRRGGTTGGWPCWMGERGEGPAGPRRRVGRPRNGGQSHV